MKLNEIAPSKITREVIEHINEGYSVVDNVYRLMSDKFIEFVQEARELYNKGIIEQLDEFDREILEGDLGEIVEHNGEMVPLDLPILDEAEYKGRDVDVNKPMRSSGPKKFKVYVKDPKTGNIRVVHFGAKEGGQRLAVKMNDPEARRNFASRHKCDQRNDKTTPSYWSCRLPRYAKQLGLSGGGSHWW